MKVKLISSSLHQVFMFLGHTSGEGGGKEETVGAVGPRKAANRSNSCLHQHHPHIRSPVVSGTSSLLPQTLLDSNGCFQHHSHASLCLSWAPAWMKEFACQVFFFFFFAFCSKIQKHYHLKSHCLLRPVFSSTKSLTLTDVMIWTEPDIYHRLLLLKDLFSQQEHVKWSKMFSTWTMIQTSAFTTFTFNLCVCVCETLCPSAVIYIGLEFQEP